MTYPQAPIFTLDAAVEQNLISSLLRLFVCLGNSMLMAVSKQWSCIKCKLSPGALHSHSAVRLHAFMLLIGGETQATLTNEVWRFHFGESSAGRHHLTPP